MEESKFVPPIDTETMERLKREGKYFPSLDPMTMLHIKRGFILCDEEWDYYKHTEAYYIYNEMDEPF